MTDDKVQSGEIGRADDHVMPPTEHDIIVRERMDRVLALPIYTLIRVGLRTPSGNIQGGVHYRVGAGLGPVGRDQTASDVLRHECSSWVRGHDWPWDFDVLASPVDVWGAVAR